MINTANEISCPMCAGMGRIKAPHLKQKILSEKRTAAQLLQKQGYSIREIMKMIGYKSPRSVQTLLKTHENGTT